MGKGKKRDRDIVISTGLIVIIGILAVLILPGMLGAGPADDIEPTTTVRTTPATAVAVNIETKMRYVPGTEPDVCVLARKHNGEDAQTEYDSETGGNDFTGFVVGEEVDFCVVEDANSGDGDFACGETSGESSNDYYASCVTKTLPNQEAYKLTIELAREGSAPSFSCLDGATDVCTTAQTGNVTMSADDQDTITVELDMGADVCFGNPMADTNDYKDLSGNTLDYGSVIECEYNQSAVDDVVLMDKGTTKDNAWKEYTRDILQSSTGSGNTTKKFKVPFDTCNTVNVEFNMYIESDASNNPALASVTCTQYDVGFFINAETGEWMFDVEDENGNDVGQSTHGAYTAHID